MNNSSAVKKPLSTKDVGPRYRAEADVGLGAEHPQENICRKTLLSSALLAAFL